MIELCFASFLQTNSLSSTNQVCSLVYRTWKCYQQHQHHTEIQTGIVKDVVRMLILELSDSLCETQGFFIDHKSMKASKKETTWCLQAYLSSLRIFCPDVDSDFCTSLIHLSSQYACETQRSYSLHSTDILQFCKTESWSIEGESRQADLQTQQRRFLQELSCPGSRDLLLPWLALAICLCPMA